VQGGEKMIVPHDPFIFDAKVIDNEEKSDDNVSGVAR
jgi:hypothetical protein